MKKRLRKKRRLGEFQELGFHVEFQTGQITEEQRDDLTFGFIDLIEEQHLACGGGSHPIEGGFDFSFFVTQERRGSATDENRTAVADWIANRKEIVGSHVGALEDAWYGH